MKEIIERLDILKEAKMPSDTIKKLARMTDSNDHAGARVLLAKQIRNKKILNIYQGIELIRDGLGHLPNSLDTLSYETDKKLKNIIFSMYDNAEEIWDAL